LSAEAVGSDVKKIGVVGTFLRDKISPWHGEETESFGGLYFTVSYLAQLAEPGDSIVPVSFVGDDFFDTLVAELSGLSNIDMSGLVKIPQKNTQVHLIYTGPQEREEVTTQPMPPLQLAQLQRLQQTDAVMVNLITGADLDLAALQAFRRTSDALIYLDLHSLALGIDENGKRFYKVPENWRAWIACVDIIQLNEMEARTLGDFSGTSVEEFVTFGRELLQLGPKICHLTRGDKGTVVVFTEKNVIRSEVVEPPAIPEVKDVIGCGDAYEAGFLLRYLKQNDVVAATKVAIRVATANCTFVGSSKIKDILTIMAEFEI